MNETQVLTTEGNKAPLPFSIRDMFLLILYLITAIFAIIGNLFVCATIRKKRRLNSATYVLIFNMAVSDILVC